MNATKLDFTTFKKVHFLILILLVNTSFPQTNFANFKSINWLIGNWQKANSITKKTSIENWHKVSETEFAGMGFTLKGKDTIFVEKLKIILQNNDLYYVADVKENKETTLFKFTSITKNGFICENPKHNFPKKIEYKLNTKHLTVIISDDKKKAKFEFDRR